MPDYYPSHYDATGLWRVVITFPRKEPLVKAQLSPRLFEVYQPTETRTRKVNGQGRVESFEAPMLPGYLFVRPLCINIPRLKGMDGVNLVHPNALTPLGMSRLYRSLAGTSKPLKSLEIEAVSDYQIGDEVEVIDTHMQAIVVEVLPENRVRALCNMLGTECRFVVSADRIRRPLS